MMKINIKDLLILALLALSIWELMMLQSVNDKLVAADDYINALESDFPDYIDVTSEGDEYHRYYCR